MDQSAYNASMFLYKSDQYEEVHMGNPIYNPFKFNGDVTRVNAEVRLVNGLGAENIAIQINDCWATPSEGKTSLVAWIKLTFA